MNTDEAELIGVAKSHISYNLFACCRNDVVNNYDPTGFKDINITKKLNKVMLKNAKYLYSLAKLYRWGSIAGVIALLYKFYSLVKTGGKWDFKNQKEWKLKSGDYYIYDGEKISAEDVGNIHFGYIGSVLFSSKTLCAGAGLYQIYSGTSSLSYWYSFFDDPRDTKRILQGRYLWKKLYNKFVFQW